MYFNSLDLGVAIGALSLGQIAFHSSYAVMYRYSTLFLVLFIFLYAIYMMKLKHFKNGGSTISNMFNN
jgi:hypothetical protein